MSNILAVYNPSNVHRGGLVVMPWESVYEQTGIKPEELVMLDDSGNPLLSQVDLIHSDDPSLGVLSFLVPQIAPSPENFSKPSAFLYVEKGTPIPCGKDLEIIKQERDNLEGYLLRNSCLEVFINLTHTPGIAAWTWYAGSATSVRLNIAHQRNKEILNPFSFHWEGHDPDKRSMQIDRVRILRPPWEKGTPSQESVFNHPYDLTSESHGPVRASITIASTPFKYEYFDPFTHESRNLECRLYRIISVPQNSDYVMEELFVKGQFQKEANKTETVNLRFTVRYFSHMDLGFDPYRYSHSVAWFVLGSDHPPYPGYGFATDAHVGPLCYPHEDPDFHEEEKKGKRFSWPLQLPKSMVRCIHKFFMFDGESVRARDAESTCRFSTGLAWFELIFKPLRATLFSEREANCHCRTSKI